MGNIKAQPIVKIVETIESLKFSGNYGGADELVLCDDGNYYLFADGEAVWSDSWHGPLSDAEVQAFHTLNNVKTFKNERLSAA